jgi:hypothetical protein
MEHWSECLDRYLEGMVIGLGIAIFITICATVTDLYYLDKQMAYEQSISDAEFEERLQEIEGWSE